MSRHGGVSSWRERLEGLLGASEGKVFVAVALGVVFLILTVVTGKAQTNLEYKVQTVLTAEVMGRFEAPQSLFFNHNTKQLLVGDTGKRRLVIFRESDGTITASKEIELKGDIGAPAHFVQNSEGRIVLSDQQERRVLILYPSGALSGPLDLSQVPDGGSVFPGALALDRSEQLYLVDETNRRILIFDSKGRFQRAVSPKDPAIRGINAIAVDAKSYIYALDTLGGSIYQLSPDGSQQKKFGQRGQEVDQFDFPVALAVDRRGFIYVVDQHRGTVVVFNNLQRYQGNIGSRGWNEGEFLFPCSIVVDDQDHVFVADRNNRRVQVFFRKTKESS